MSLQIQCPQCSLHFQVGEELENKTVECGACDTRFKIDDETIIRERARIYPGENKSALLDRIGRSPVHKEKPVAFKTATYAQNVKADALLTATAGQWGSVAVGSAILIITVLFFLLGSGKGGALQDVDLMKRIILGGFAGFIGAALIIYGAKNWRIGGTLLSGVLVSAIVALIYIQPVHITPSGADYGSAFEEENLKEGGSPVALSKEEKLEALKKSVGYEKVQGEIDEAGSPEGVAAVYVYPFEERYKTILLNFFSGKFQLTKKQIPSTYHRDNGRSFLMIYTGLPLEFDQIVNRCQVLGSVVSHPELRLVEIKLNGTHFQEPTTELFQKLTDPENPDFSAANLKELRHIDILRATKAIERIDQLSSTAKLSFKPEVVKELVRLLAENEDDEVAQNIGNALRTWAGEDQAVAEKVGAIVLDKLDDSVPSSLVEYLIDGKASQIPVIIDALWARNPITWAGQYEALGASAESRLLYHLKESPLVLKKSAADILRIVGTKKSLSPLQAAKKNKDVDFKITLDRAIQGIRSRN